MIFTKADRERAERIETALTSLGLNVGVRGEGSPLFKRIHDMNVLLHEVVLSQDKLMQSHAALEKQIESLNLKEVADRLHFDVERVLRRESDLLRLAAKRIRRRAKSPRK